MDSYVFYVYWVSVSGDKLPVRRGRRSDFMTLCPAAFPAMGAGEAEGFARPLTAYKKTEWAGEEVFRSSAYSSEPINERME
jgi:hypothetical protein